MGFITEFIEGLRLGYEQISVSVPVQHSNMLLLIGLTILLTAYAIFTWKFYRFLAEKDIISINLNKYNTTTHPGTYKFVALILYFLEYIVLLPFLVFFWFVVISIILLILTDQLAINQILLITAAVLATTRILAYYSDDLAKEVAKSFPFTVIIILILNPAIFSVARITENLSQIPSLMSTFYYFLFFIIALELVLRVADLVMGREKIG